MRKKAVRGGAVSSRNGSESLGYIRLQKKDTLVPFVSFCESG